MPIPTGAAGGDLAGSFPNPTLTTTGVAANTYTKLTVDTKGRVTAGTTLSSADLPAVPVAAITGTLPVGNGGTGATTFTNNGVILGNSGSNLLSTAAGTSAQVLRVPNGGGVPSFGAIDLTQAGAISGTLAVANGGTGLVAGTSGGIPYFSASSTMSSSGALTANGVVLGGGTGASPTTTAAGSANQTLRIPSGGGAPVFGALDLTQSAAVTGTLGVANGGTGTSATPTAGQLHIGNGAGFTLATLTSGTGINVANSAGVITINATADASTKVSKSGDVMTGVLTLPANGLIAGTSQLVLSGGNVGIGTTSPAALLRAGTTSQFQVSASGDLASIKSVFYSWPASQGGASTILTNNGSGTLTWTSGAAPTGSASGDLVGSYPNPTLATTGVTAGTYAKVSVDAKGRVLGSAALVATDLPVHSAALITSGTLTVPNGGTGVTTFTSNGVLLGNGAGAINASGTGNAAQILRIPSAGGAPSFGALDLSQAAAVTGTLAVANGGTGVSTGAANLMFATPNGSAGAPSLRSLTATDLPVHSAALISSGTLGVANGGTGTVATPTNGQLHIGNGSAFTLATLTSGTGINVVNAAGSITINATADASTKVSKAGDTMTGTLNLPANGLVAGSNQLVLSGGNVGIGTTSPSEGLEIGGGKIRVTTPVGGTGYIDFREGGSPLEGLGIAADMSFAAGSNKLYFSATSGGSVPSSANALMTLQTNGNVGIGTTSPAENLTIAGVPSYNNGLRLTGSSNSGTGLALENTAASGHKYALLSAGSGDAVGAGGFGIYDDTATAYRLAVTASGYVGIGTTAPAGLLDVNQKLTVLSSGNVGIGTTAPQMSLQVAGGGGFTGGYTGMGNTYTDRGQKGGGIELGYDQTNNIGHLDSLSEDVSWRAMNYGAVSHNFFLGGGSTASVVINTNGNLGIGTTSPSYMLHVNGSVAGVGAYNALSDIRYKKDVKSLAHSLAKVLAIRGVTYKWIDEDKYGSQTQIGVIAQEIEKIVPEVVTTGSDGVKRVKYTDLIPLVIEAMQEQNAELELLKADSARKDEAIEQLNAVTAQLRADNSQIKSESAQLKSFICGQFPTAPMCK